MVAYHVGNYQELFQLLACRPYHESSHAEMQALWFAGQYAVAQVYDSFIQNLFIHPFIVLIVF